MGAECLPARLPSLRRVCDPVPLRARRRHADFEGLMRTAGRTRIGISPAGRVAAAAFVAVGALWMRVPAARAWPPQTTPIQRAAPAPTIVVETTRGTFAFETFPAEAPKTVAHIV